MKILRRLPLGRLFGLALLLSLLGALLAFLAWAAERPSARYLSDLRSEIISAPAPAPDSANLILLRPQLYPLDYQSPAHLRLKLVAALDKAREAGLLGEQTLVALPEHTGTWLLARDQKVEFYKARSRQEVRDWLLLGNPLLAMRALVSNLDADRLDEALLRMQAAQMAVDYQTLFSELARDYQITLLAGSILLPEPGIENGRLLPGDGPLRNLSLVFGPDGELVGEPYSEPWPWRPTRDEPQRIMLAGHLLEVERDWRPGYPQSRLLDSDGSASEPLFLRGKLSWPIGGATRDIELTPQDLPQASEAPGSHLLNQWIVPR
jgi:hypothetical protein